MSNANSVVGYAQSGTLRNQWPTQTIAATTETAFTIGTDTGSATGFVVLPTGGQVYGSATGLDVNANPAVIDRSSYLYGLPSGESNDQFNSSSWNARKFRVRVTGTGNAGANAAQSVIINLRQGTSATPGSNNLVGASGSALATVAGGAFNFWVEAEAIWDPTSQILSGVYNANIAFGSTSQYTAAATGTKFVFASVTAAALSFSGTITLGNGASSTVNVSELVIERI